MKKKLNVIKISGFKGILVVLFVIGCLAAGFLIFPGWVSMHIWNFVAGYFSQIPQMQLVHGVILWCITALSIYALNNGNFAVSFSASQPIPPSEDKIKEIIKQIHEKNATIVSVPPKEEITDGAVEKTDAGDKMSK